MKKLSDYVIESLADFGVKHIFMLTGGGCMHLTDSIGRHPAIDYVCCLHEQACAFAAEHYAEYTDHLGVALVTTGPGGTNAVTGLTAAWLESAPVLLLSGQAKRADLIGGRAVRNMGPQEVNIIEVVKPVTKYAKTVLDPESIRYELEKALYLATHGRRGPVWLDLPLDVQASQIDETNLVEFHPPALPRAEALEPQVARAIRLLNRAERPVLMIGNGCRRSPELVRQLIDTLRIPVLVTWKAIDMVADACEYFAGRPGLIGQRGANFSQQNSDCMLVAGARLDLLQTAFNHRNFARAAAKILVDIDPAEIAKLDMEIDVPICADTADFIREFLRQSGSLAPRDRTCWVKRTKEWQERYPVVTSEHWNGQSFVSTYALVDVLSDELGPDDLLVPGSSGACSEVFLQAFRVKAGQRIVNAPTLGAMGTGLPGTIGACVASCGRRTVSINGDGGFQLNIQELETVHRLNLPIKYFILCNGSYASIMATQRNYFQGRFAGADPSSHLTFPDIRRLAAAYGIQTAHIHDHSNLRQRVREVLALAGPVICAVDVSSNEVTAPRVGSQVQPDGTIVSAPMEDMSPLLDREEFAANMIIPPLEER